MISIGISLDAGVSIETIDSRVRVFSGAYDAIVNDASPETIRVLRSLRKRCFSKGELDAMSVGVGGEGSRVCETYAALHLLVAGGLIRHTLFVDDAPFVTL